MSEKMTVKDLSGDLHVSPKDMLQALRQLGIPAKSASSPVPTEYVETVRAHFRAPDDIVSRTQMDSGVIVRRRRAKEVEGVADVTDAPDAPDAHDVTGAVDAPDVADAPHAVGVADAASLNIDENAQPSPNKAQAVSTTEPAAKAAHTPPRVASAPAAKHDRGSAGKQGQARTARRMQIETPPARIISQPPAPAPAPVPGPAPALFKIAPKAPGSAPTPKAAASVPASEVRVSAPHALEAPSSSIAALAEMQTDNTVIAPTSQRTARHTTPDASALPEGSSAPTLLPRTPEDRTQEAAFNENTNDEDRRRRRKKRVVETPAPQVRVISRPSPEAVARAAEIRSGDARSAAARPGGQSGHAGPGGYGGHGGHSGHGRPAAARPAGPGGGAGGPGGAPSGPRPPRSGAPGGAPGTAGAPAGEARDGQSKKKRMKGRRTVDFQQGAGDFARRGLDDDNTTRLGRSSRGRRKGRDTRPLPVTTQPLKAAKRKIRVTEAIRVADMAHQMGLKSSEIIKVLFGLGIMATINQSLDIDTATLVAAEFEYEVEKAGFSEDDYLIPAEADAPDTLITRPPVVTIMGHVDHGKTSLLDAVRKSNVTGGEAGGITQHIGAYHVRTKRGEIVFLDTPGHEAFTAMRARGAQVTDLVILVVAADDGVMEQTREAINHSKAAGVPIMVAVNKMDKPGADSDRVLRELADIGLQAEEWGGDTVIAKVSAKTRQGLDELLELVALQAEILELKANPEKHARGRIVEAKLDKGRGPVATVLIQEGTLRQGDVFVCGVFSGRVRAVFNDQSKKIKEAGPSMPVEVQGFDGVPEAGEEFICVADEKVARRIADARSIKQRERDLAKESKVTLETFLSRRASDQETLNLNLVLKADVQGSLEAITEALIKQSTEKVRINVVHGGAGAISESDIMLAAASQAIIIGFNVRPTAKVKEVAERENVDVRFYNIIYKLADDIKSAMTGMLAPVQREQYLGQAEVRELYNVPKVGLVAGSHVSDGKIVRNAGARLLRDGVVVYTGKIGSLRRFKDDMREVLKGYECGIGLENYHDIKVGDVIETFEMIEEAATL